MDPVKKVYLASALLAAIVLATGCNPAGPVRPAADLSPHAVSASEFPFGPGTAVPAPQVPGIVADITLRPLRGAVEPADCTPVGVDAASATVIDGPGPIPASNLTELVAATGESLVDFAAAATRCATFRGTSPVADTVATTIVAPLSESDGVARIQVSRTLTPPSADRVTVLDQWIAQRGDLRVVVQLRHSGALTEEARATVAGFFDTAVERAFSR